MSSIRFLQGLRSIDIACGCYTSLDSLMLDKLSRLIHGLSSKRSNVELVRIQQTVRAPTGCRCDPYL